MGTINYGRSEYITIGIEPYDTDNYTDEFGNVDYDAMVFDYDCDRENVEFLFNKYNFGYFNVEIKSGYYEGFYISIENNNMYGFDCWQDKREAQKEVTALKRFLLECVDLGLCEVWPGWCTSYKDRETSIKAIQQAAREMREDIRKTPTVYTCQRLGIAY